MTDAIQGLGDLPAQIGHAIALAYVIEAFIVGAIWLLFATR